MASGNTWASQGLAFAFSDEKIGGRMAIKGMLFPVQDKLHIRDERRCPLWVSLIQLERKLDKPPDLCGPFGVQFPDTHQCFSIPDQAGPSHGGEGQFRAQINLTAPFWPDWHDVILTDHLKLNLIGARLAGQRL